jgi:hypothetical protein
MSMISSEASSEPLDRLLELLFTRRDLPQLWFAFAHDHAGRRSHQAQLLVGPWHYRDFFASLRGATWRCAISHQHRLGGYSAAAH